MVKYCYFSNPRVNFSRGFSSLRENNHKIGLHSQAHITRVTKCPPNATPALQITKSQSQSNVTASFTRICAIPLNSFLSFYFSCHSMREICTAASRLVPSGVDKKSSPVMAQTFVGKKNRNCKLISNRNKKTVKTFSQSLTL